MANYVRIYTGDDGLSHMEEVALPFEPFTDKEGAHGQGTPMEAATGITFRVSPQGYFLDWHNAPRRQYVVTLTGQVEIEASDGTVKRMGPGDILLAEDVTGRGHTTRVIGEEPRFYVIIPLAE